MTLLYNLSWQHFIRSINLCDLLDVKTHSADFQCSRANYIFIRVRTLALMFALLSLVWIPFDYLLLPIDKFYIFTLLRILSSCGFIGLGIWYVYPYSPKLAYIRLALLISIPSLFYITAIWLLYDFGDLVVSSGYAHFPFVLIMLGAIFPLTLIEGLLASGLVLSLFIAVQLLSGVFFTFANLNQLWLLGLLAGIALWTELSQLHILLRLYRQATRDPLTGLFNRHVLMEQLQHAVEQAEYTKTPLSVLLFDLDRFKRINDTYGHLTGDIILRAFADILETHINGQHVVGRYGGEEFLAILPGVNKQDAVCLAEKIRAICSGTTTEMPDKTKLNFTTSIGVALLRPNETMENLLNRVDERLYFAKEKGRDRVIWLE